MVLAQLSLEPHLLLAALSQGMDATLAAEAPSADAGLTAVAAAASPDGIRTSRLPYRNCEDRPRQAAWHTTHSLLPSGSRK